MRDGRRLTGTLRCYDQFANLVLHDTVEILEKEQVSIGLLLVRGENVALVGEVLDPFVASCTTDSQEDYSLKAQILRKMGFSVEKSTRDAFRSLGV